MAQEFEVIIICDVNINIKSPKILIYINIYKIKWHSILYTEISMGKRLAVFPRQVCKVISLACWERKSSDFPHKCLTAFGNYRKGQSGSPGSMNNHEVKNGLEPGS